MINVPAIAALAVDVVGHQTFSIQRRTGSYQNGAWIDDPNSAPISATGTVQPARGKDLLRLTEGRRGEEALRIITRTQLFGPQPLGSASRADVVVWGGANFEVEAVETYDGAFYDAVAVRQGS